MGTAFHFEVDERQTENAVDGSFSADHCAVGKCAWDTDESNEKTAWTAGALELEHNLGHPAESAARNRRVVGTAPPSETRSAQQRKHPVVEMG